MSVRLLPSLGRRVPGKVPVIGYTAAWRVGRGSATAPVPACLLACPWYTRMRWGWWVRWPSPQVAHGILCLPSVLSYLTVLPSMSSPSHLPRYRCGSFFHRCPPTCYVLPQLDVRLSRSRYNWSSRASVSQIATSQQPSCNAPATLFSRPNDARWYQVQYSVPIPGTGTVCTIGTGTW